MGLLMPTLAERLAVHSVQDDTSFATGDGALVSLFRVEGLTRLYARGVGSELMERIYRALPAFFLTTGHRLQWTVARDPAWAHPVVERQFSGLERQARRIGMDTAGFTNGPPNDRFQGHFLPERGYLALWTDPNILTPHDAQLEKRARNRKLEQAQVAWGPWQVPGLALGGLIPTHAAACEALLAALGIGPQRLGLRIVPLNTREAMLAWREMLDPDRGADPQQGDALATIYDAGRPPLMADPFGPHIPQVAAQVLPPYTRVGQGETIQAGGHYVRMLAMTLGPSHPVDFRDLYDHLPADLPMRYTLHLAPWSGGGRLKTLAAAILTWSNGANRLINAARRDVLARSQAGDPACSLQMLFSTWGKTPEEAGERARRLAQRIGSWGGVMVEDVFGDPLPAWLASIPGLMTQGPVRTHLLNLSDACAFFPVASQVSPWSEGPCLLRGPQGQPLPIAIGSSLQKNFNIAIFAATRSGKSVLLALLLLLAHLLEPGRARLPRFAFLDVGYGGMGLASLIQELLGPRDYLVQSQRLRNDEAHAINPFDTLLGMREPLPLHRAFLLDLLAMVGTPMGQKDPAPGIYEMAGPLVELAYRRFSDHNRLGTPKEWEPEREGMAEVDRMVQNAIAHAALPRRPSWWAIVDWLALEQRRPDLAISAQRYAMPLLQDLIGLVRDDEIYALYKEAGHAGMREGAADLMARFLTEATRDYPILNAPTAFNLGAARGTVLDLAEVTAGTGPDAEKRTSILYLTARWALTGSWYVHPDDLAQTPDAYREFHEERIRETWEDPKFVIYDEFHRTGGARAVRRVVDRDAREGGKFNVRLALSSQSVLDFDGEFIDEHVATRFILSAPDDTSALAERFHLTAAEEQELKRLTGPGPHGSPILALFDTREGPYRLFCSDPVPLEWLWAFSTTSEDRAVLNRLQAHMTPGEARSVAAARFGASAKNLLERIARQGLRVNSADEVEGVAADRLVKEVLETWNRDWVLKALRTLGYRAEDAA